MLNFPLKYERIAKKFKLYNLIDDENLPSSVNLHLVLNDNIDTTNLNSVVDIIDLLLFSLSTNSRQFDESQIYLNYNTVKDLINKQEIYLSQCINILMKNSIYKGLQLNKSISIINIKNNINVIKTELNSGATIIFGIMIYSSFDTDEFKITKTINLPDTNDDYLLGGICAVFIGYDDDNELFTIKCNSDNVFSDGYFYLPYEYFSNSLLTTDLWQLQLFNNNNNIITPELKKQQIVPKNRTFMSTQSISSQNTNLQILTVPAPALIPQNISITPPDIPLQKQNYINKYDNNNHDDNYYNNYNNNDKMEKQNSDIHLDVNNQIQKTHFKITSIQKKQTQVSKPQMMIGVPTYINIRKRTNIVTSNNNENLALTVQNGKNIMLTNTEKINPSLSKLYKNPQLHQSKPLK